MFTLKMRLTLTELLSL